MSLAMLSLPIAAESDVVTVRQHAREVAIICGFGAQDQARIATAVTEMARNVRSYAQHGSIQFLLDEQASPPLLEMRVIDHGPGIADIQNVLTGQHRNVNGFGLGIPGARRLVDHFEISSELGHGTLVVLKKFLPRDTRMREPGAIAHALDAMRMKLATPALSGYAEVQQQNRELLATLAELKMRQEEQLLLTRELEDTNRGVVALYAELDEKARHLRHADETKSRFLSNMSHEFRTPLSSIRALAKLLLARTDGELGEEQEKQVRFILDAAESLTEMVNDLLDLAKIEAGKVDIHCDWFSVREMFSALRGMLRPLLMSDQVKLSFDMPDKDIMLYTDEGKLSQILRNFISNALKFTEAGSVRVQATLMSSDGMVQFSVTDTGLGIAEENQHLIFEEFSQVANRLQHRIKGTGLGLPLCRNLASLLGGTLTLQSTAGKGSTFSVMIPSRYLLDEATADGSVLPAATDPQTGGELDADRIAAHNAPQDQARHGGHDDQQQTAHPAAPAADDGRMPPPVPENRIQGMH